MKTKIYKHLKFSLFILLFISCKEQESQLINHNGMISFVAPKIKSNNKITDKKILDSTSKFLVNNPINSELKADKKTAVNPLSIDGESETPMIVTNQNKPSSTIVVNLGTFD
jgi:hypothetical protein